MRSVAIVTLIFGIVLWAFPAHAFPSPENGVQREYYPDGKIHLENIFKNGHLVRKRAYYPNGHLLLQEKYKDNVLVSKSTYFENGQIKSRWTKKSGVTKFYFENGEYRGTSGTPQDNIKKKHPSSYIFSGSSQ
jgi:antitoxin component YwqK of YwqJK toxin-antitoxin module